MKKLCVLGVTGSIGINVCDVVKQNPNDFEIVGVALSSNIETLRKILFDHPSIKYIAIQNYELGEQLKKDYPELIVYNDDNYLINVIDAYSYDMVVNSLVGFDGLIPTIHTLNKNIDCALANKESLVVGGELINKILQEKDSEISKLKQDKEMLIQANGNLLLKVPQGREETPEIEKEKDPRDFDFRTVFENGKFKR